MYIRVNPAKETNSTNFSPLALIVAVYVCGHNRPIPGEIEGVVQAVEEDKRDRPDFFESW